MVDKVLAYLARIRIILRPGKEQVLTVESKVPLSLLGRSAVRHAASCCGNINTAAPANLKVRILIFDLHTLMSEF